MEGGSLGRRQAAASIAGKGKASGGGGSQEQSIVGGDSGYLSFMGMAYGIDIRHWHSCGDRIEGGNPLSVS